MDKSSWLVLGGVIALLGVSSILAPIVVEPSQDVVQYRLDVQAKSSTPTDANIIAYDELPPDAQQVFDQARKGDTLTLTRTHNKTAIETFQTYQYVHYQGQPYQIRLYHIDNPNESNLVLRLVGGVLTALGGALIVYGGYVVQKRKLRVLTPRNSLLLPVGALVAFYLSPASITGGLLSFPAASYAQSLIGLPAIALLIPGTLCGRGRVREAIGICLLGLLVLGAGFAWAGVSLVVLVFVVVLGGTFGAIPFALGARLTENDQI